MFNIGDPHTTIEFVSSESDGNIIVQVQAAANTLVTVSAHTESDFSDPGISAQAILLGTSQSITITGLEDESLYYIRVQGKNQTGEMSPWNSSTLHPYYIPLKLRNPIVDVIPEDKKIKVLIDSPLGTPLVIQLSLDESFSAITAEKKLASTGTLLEIIFDGDIIENGNLYFVRIKNESMKDWASPIFPVEPNTPDTRSIYFLSTLAKIGKKGYPMDAVYVLKADLDFEDANNDGIANDPFDTDKDSSNGNWEPLGDSNAVFSGGFLGEGHTIRGMRIEASHDNNIGLFRYLGFNKDSSHSVSGVISDLGLLDIKIDGNNQVGGLAGETEAGTKIKNSSVSGEIKGHIQVGGLGGLVFSNITNSYTNVMITADQELGGLAGNLTGSITNAYSTGEITGKRFVGGLAGILDSRQGTESVIDSTYAMTTVIGNVDVGGLIGAINSAECFVFSSLLAGSVSGNSQTGVVTGDVFPNKETSRDVDNFYYLTSPSLPLENNEDSKIPAAAATRDLFDNENWWYGQDGLNWGDKEMSSWQVKDYIGRGAFPHLLEESAAGSESSAEIPNQPLVLLPE